MIEMLKSQNVKKKTENYGKLSHHRKCFWTFVEFNAISPLLNRSSFIAVCSETTLLFN